MRAIGVYEYGGPDALEILDLPEPQAGQGEVRIRVHAVAVNPTDTGLREGLYGDRFGDRNPPYVPGMDASGVIDQLGDGVGGRLALGQSVVALVDPALRHGGTYADKIVVPAASVVAAPADVDDAAASTLLMNAMTARIALDTLGLAAGELLAVSGAAGAFGGYVIQLAKADGLRVVADAKPADEELVRGLGADHVVERGDRFTDRIRDLVPDGVRGFADGALLNERALPAVADGGRLASVRGWAGPTERRITAAPVSVRTAVTETARLDKLARQAEAGTLSLRVAQVFPAEQAPEAHRLLAAGGLRGRLVLDFS